MRKPPSPKVTFGQADLKNESSANLSRKGSTRHGMDPREQQMQQQQQQQQAAELARRESVKPRYRDKEGDLTRSTSQVCGLFVVWRAY